MWIEFTRRGVELDLANTGVIHIEAVSICYLVHKVKQLWILWLDDE